MLVHRELAVSLVIMLIFVEREYPMVCKQICMHSEHVISLLTQFECEDFFYCAIVQKLSTCAFIQFLFCY